MVTASMTGHVAAGRGTRCRYVQRGVPRERVLYCLDGETADNEDASAGAAFGETISGKTFLDRSISDETISGLQICRQTELLKVLQKVKNGVALISLN